MKNLCFMVWSIALLTLAGCGATKNSTSQAVNSATGNGKNFGETITAANAVPYDQLLLLMQNQDSIAVKVVGQVESVCQVKGCWMNLTSTQPNAPKMMVKFKDYAFFMPKDLAGKQVVIQGHAYREVTSVEELRHYAEDAGKSASEVQAITSPKVELKFMAAGVLLLD